jgi:hypothetical protein
LEEHAASIFGECSSRQCLVLYTSESVFFPSAINNLKIKIHKNIILSVVLYGYEMWSLTLRKDHILRTFEDRLLRRMLGVKGMKKIANELHNLYYSPSIIRMIKSRRMGWAVV